MIKKLSSKVYPTYRNELLELKKKIKHILPFRFLATILNIPENNGYLSGGKQLQTILGEGWINYLRRETFFKEFSESINEKYTDPKEDFEIFCKAVCPKSETPQSFQLKLQVHYEKKEWNELLKKVLNLI